VIKERLRAAYHRLPFNKIPQIMAKKLNFSPPKHGISKCYCPRMINLKQGIKCFGKEGYEAARKELRQLNEREVFKPISIQTMTHQEKRRAMDSLIFLVEKRDGRIKARACANGSTQRSYIGKEDTTSPTVLTEAILITAAIEADQQRDVMTVDIPNAFVQTEIKDTKEKITMKIKGKLAEMLILLDEQRYKDFLVLENGEEVIYVQVIKALYGMLQASILFYQKLRTDLEEIGFKINLYDPCVANRIINGSRHTVKWHVDDLKSSHIDPKVNDRFLEWLEKKYGDKNLGSVNGKINLFYL
jgi:hypothetical protein